MSPRRTAIATLIAFGVMATAASSSQAATTIGSTAQGGASQTCFGATLFVQAASAGPSYVVPDGGGVITSWSVHGYGASAQVTLKIVREGEPATYLIKGSSLPGTLAASGTTTFPTRLPVAAGDEIALWVPDKAPCNFVSDDPGDVQAYIGGVNNPEPAAGSVFGPMTDFGSNFRLNVSAQLEPDADGDGFGDETQDLCPSAAATQGRCDATAPETTITRAPKPLIETRRKRAKVMFVFRSSETSRFSCTLDGTTKPCWSPFEARVRKGKHQFSVAARDSAGNVDGTPATHTFEVKRKKRP